MHIIIQKIFISKLLYNVLYKEGVEMNELVKAMLKTMFSSPIYWIIVIIGIAAYIVMKIRESKIAKESYKCPRCGGQLQIKNGRYGKFIGCKNYPYCQYTRNIKYK